MTQRVFTSYRLLLEPLTPVHVGSGQTIELHEYEVLKQRDGCWLMVFDLCQVLADVEERRQRELEKLAEVRDVLGLRRWIRQNVKEHHILWKVRLSELAYDEIRKGFKNPDRSGEIHMFTRTPVTGQPYFPGSSIKGAIRTALVDMLARKDKNKISRLKQLAQELASNKNFGGAKFEANALGYAKEKDRVDLYHDPFRQLAISDIMLPPESFLVDRVQIITRQGRSPSGAENIPIFRDLFMPPQSGNCTVEGQLRLYGQVATVAKLPHKFDIKTICEACNRFYKPRLESELGRFTCEPKTKERLLEAANTLEQNQCLVRIGRHSHFECVTLGEPFHQPPARGFGKSRTYVKGTIPLGWVRLTIG